MDELKVVDVGNLPAAERRQFYDGMRSAIHEYVVWRDGTQYVGCGVVTLRQALELVDFYEAESDKWAALFDRQHKSKAKRSSVADIS